MKHNRIPTLSMLEALEIKEIINLFSKGEILNVPSERYCALIEDQGRFIGVVYSSRNGFSSSFTKKNMKFKQYCEGARPAILVQNSLKIRKTNNEYG